MGTDYLHDSIVQSTKMSLEDFKNVSEFCLRIAKVVCRKYNTRIDHYGMEVAAAIERAFQVGNINYLLDIFKNSYDRDKMKVTKNAFIMTVRKKIVEELELQNSYNETQLRIIIQGELEGINDIRILQGMHDIVLSLQHDRN